MATLTRCRSRVAALLATASVAIAFAAAGLALALTLPAAATGWQASGSGDAPTALAAASGTGKVQLRIGGKGRAARGMRVEDVRFGALGAASKRGRRVVLPVGALAVERTARVKLRGGIVFRHGRRRVVLRALRVVVAPRRVKLSARLGKRRLPLFVARAARGRAKLDRTATTARLGGARLSLTRRAARTFRKRLRLDRLPAGPLGAFGVNARGKGADSAPDIGGGGRTPSNPGGGGPGTGSPGGDPKDSCSVAGAPPLDELPPEPTPYPRPASAADITSASITWNVRDSFIRYVNAGEGTSVADGATADDPEVRPGSSASLAYSFHYPFAHGWFDEDTGRAALNFTGTVKFGYCAHGVDIEVKDAELEINTGDPRLIFRFDGTGDTDFGDRRGVLVELADGGPVDGGGTWTYTSDGTIPSGSDGAIFAGFYPAGADFGSVEISFRTAP